MIVFDQQQGYFYSDSINDKNYLSGFSTRALGDGRRIDPILKFLKNNGLAFKKLVVLEQIHSVNIEMFVNSDRENFTKIEETDGVVTKEKDTVLTVRTGDCCPLIFADKTRGIIGVSHQGWRGSLKRMSQKMTEKMIFAGAAADSIKVAIGPTIGECCYDITEDRYYEFMEEFDNYANLIFHYRGGRRHLNLTRLNYLLLLEAGIKAENIDHFPFCTKCDKNRFFSFRRDKKEDYGEMFSFIINR